MQPDISPEEKLLSIIKGSRDKPQEQIDNGKLSKKDDGLVPVKAGSRFDDYLSIVLKSSFFKSSVFDPDILKVFNKYMAIVVALMSLYFIWDILFVHASRRANSIIADFSVKAMPVPVPQRAAKAETMNYSFYSNKIAGKKIFAAGSSAGYELRDTTDTSSEQQENNIGLVGIIPGDKPQAIIEDKKSQKTYYLMKGQSISDISVEEIDKDQVTIEYKGKRINLFL